ncbi:unnamed protein product [Caenorhabditis brenneri]
MDATALFALCNAMMANATGTPLMLPIITAPTFDQNPSTSNSAATPNSSHKAEKEAERRDKTNQRFAELQQLVRKDYNEKMSQADILKYALKAAINHKREFYSDPRTRGLYAALGKIEQLTIQHSNSLNFPIITKYTNTQRVEKFFEDFRDIFLPVFTPESAPEGSPAPSTSGAPASDDADLARKEIRAKREQARRDKQADGFGLLRQFIKENHLVKTGDQKIQTLECIIAYLKTKPSTHPSQTDAAQFDIGFTHGRHLGQNLIVSFFKSDVHLFPHTNALFNFINSQLGPVYTIIHKDDIKFDITAVMKFKALYPAIFELVALMTPPPTAPQTPV